MKTCLLLLLIITAPCLAQSPPPKESSKSSLEGQVVKDPTSLPVKKAEVTLISESGEERTSYSATTDAEGKFRLEGIRPGRYRAFVERTGMVEIGKQSRRSPGTALSFEAGKDVSGLVLHMLPAAVITGRVLDEDGDPMPRTDIAVLRYGYTFGQRRLETAASGTTNDLGEYRVADLLPGKYLVVASPTPDFSTVTTSAPPHQDALAKEVSYVPTYYPGTSDRSQAAFLDLRAGDEVPVDFNLVPSPTFHVRGSLADIGSATAMLVLRPKDSNTEFAAADTDRDGKFDIHRVPPGSYTLLALSNKSDVAQIAHQAVEVTNSDLENLRIVPLPASRVRGHVRVEGDRSIDLSSLVIFLRSSDADSSSAFMSNEDLSTTVARVNRDGTFEFKNVSAGNYSVVLEASGAASDLYLKSVSLGSTDVTNNGLTVGGGAYAMELLIRKGAARLEGGVTDSDDHPVPDAVVIAVPQGSRRDRFELYAKGMTDQHGRFSFSGLTPGAYAVFAFESIEEGAYYDDAVLRPNEGRSEKIHLEENSKQAIQLKVIPASGN
jgi:protocatechuate 3,4-dioxygenase beta subunit